MNAPITALESQRSSDVKYMLMMHAPRAGWTTAGIGSWPPEDVIDEADVAAAPRP